MNATDSTLYALYVVWRCIRKPKGQVNIYKIWKKLTNKKKDKKKQIQSTKIRKKNRQLTIHKSVLWY